MTLDPGVEAPPKKKACLSVLEVTIVAQPGVLHSVPKLRAFQARKELLLKMTVAPNSYGMI